jgi:spore coat protein H
LIGFSLQIPSEKLSYESADKIAKNTFLFAPFIDFVHLVRMNSRLKLTFFFSLIFAIVLNAQNVNPDEDAVYLEREITEIRITMSAEDKELIHAEENRYEEIYVPSEIKITNSELDNVVATGAGVRLRGNTSRGHDKRPYKIDFKEFDGSKFEGYKKFNLKPNVNDPTIVRELLSMHLYRAMNVPAIRVTPATVYINEEYMGVYLNTEQIDDEFVDSRFGHEEGFLYKCSYGANLSDDGQIFSNEIYESKINEEEDTRAELDAFVKILNNTPTANFKTEIEKVLNVDSYLRQMAVESVLGHWDGYSYNQNNFYLFYDAQTKLIEFIPYDADNTWGIDWIDRDWATRDLLSFYRGGNPRPLSTRILNVEEYKNLYIDYLNELYKNYFTDEYLEPLFDHYESLLKPYVELDSYYELAFGFTMDDYTASFRNGTKSHVEYGLRGFLDTRRSTGWEEILRVTGLVENKKLTIYPNPSTQSRFSFSSIDKPEVHMYDVSGKAIAIRINQLSTGNYEVTLLNGTQNEMYLINVNGIKSKWFFTD